MASRWDGWYALARSVPVLEVAASVGARLKKITAVEYAGPCPACGGTDRFSCNTHKNVFQCRGSRGGSGIDMLVHVTGCTIIEAAERLTGEPRPDHTRDETPQEREARLKRNAERIAQAQEREEEQRKEDEAKAKRNVATIADILKRAVPVEGTQGEAYLKETRKLEPPSRLLLDCKFVKDLDYWGYADNDSGNEIIQLATLPALIWLIRNFAGAVIGSSETYLDPQSPVKWTPTASPRNSSKKIRGTKLGGMIRMGPVGRTLAIPEGPENGLAWWQRGEGPEDVTLAAAVDLGNLAGRSTGQVNHPWLADRDGRPARISNGIPDMDHPGVVLPDGVEAVIILADGDSEPAATTMKVLCAANRFEVQGRQVSIVWPRMGTDFNEMLQDDGR
jgi:hypothetical protein